jgi:hypothetical protein
VLLVAQGFNVMCWCGLSGVLLGLVYIFTLSFGSQLKRRRLSLCFFLNLTLNMNAVKWKFVNFCISLKEFWFPWIRLGRFWFTLLHHQVIIITNDVSLFVFWFPTWFPMVSGQQLWEVWVITCWLLCVEWSELFSK